MLIHCPKCGVPSNVDPAYFRSHGTVVLCEVCGTRWSPSDIGDGASAPALRLEPAVAAEATVIDHVGAGFARKVPPHRRLDDLPSPEPKKDWRRIKAAGTVLGAIVLAIAVSVPLLSAVPGLASIQGVSEGAGALSFRDVKTHTIMRGGTRAILVQGEIVNGAGVSVDLPKVRVTLRGADGRSVDSALVQPAAVKVVAGGTVGFRNLFAAPTEDAADVVVDFATAADEVTGAR